MQRISLHGKRALFVPLGKVVNAAATSDAVTM
jgi:hypothetical protein